MVADNLATPPIVNGVNGHTTAYRYSKQHLGKPRPIRIIFVGSGLSGIAAVHIFKEKFQHLPIQLVIYEKNEDVGGTWLENRYPGCACDVPAHCYTFSWEGNPNWSKAYVGALELFEYFKDRAIEYGVYNFVHFNHRVNSATWNKGAGKWVVQIENLVSGNTITDEAEVLISAVGFLNSWKWPSVSGLLDFKGKLMHSARWDDDYDFEGKTVAVIGSGSSAIQIVPQLQPTVEKLTSFNRSPTWITPEFAAEFAPEGRETHFSEDQKQAWASDPQDFLAYRKSVEASINSSFDLQIKNSNLQRDLFAQFTETMKERLAGKEVLAQKIVPTFAVGCRRITPGHGYLEALSADNVTVRTDPISQVQSDGIKMLDGTFIKIDALVCATGFDTSFRPPFRLIGEEGEDLRDVWAEEPRSYLSIGASGFPNYFTASGPNFPLANGGLIPCLEACVTYAFEAVAKIQRDGIKAMSPKMEAVDDFQEHKDSLMEDLVWTDPCVSWYKNGKADGKVWGPWCGSSLHFLELMSKPRWEDWKIEYQSANRFAFLGYGKTLREESGGDLAYYLAQPSVK